MALLTQRKFSFTSTAAAPETFAVVSFSGIEALSTPYRFDLVLLTEKSGVNALDVLKNPATFTIHRDGEEDVLFNGILTQFEETREVNNYLFFRAVLAPRLQRLSLIQHNQVFLDQPVPKIIEAVLKEAGLSSMDFEFKLQGTYPPREYVCEYGESHLNFISRWAEREGIYYFFEQSKNGEKIIFTDTKISHTDLSQGKDLIYNPQSGLDSLQTREVVKSFICKHNLVPQKVYLKDYNYRKPSLTMEGSAAADPDGWGEHYIYGEHFSTPDEGKQLAKIRAEEFLCRKSVYYGSSSIPFLLPGFTFDLDGHYQKSSNQKYLLTEINHEGHQTGYLVSGISSVLESRSEQMFYANSFAVIPAETQFRPEREAVKPKIAGTFNATVDAASSGQYAEIDDQGRYKVILPLDRSGRGSGKASAYCRMMQPYAGADYGMHFPLHKGTEVLLTFIDGDPDRPIIAGSVPNPETRTPVKGANQTQSVIRSGGGNQLHMGDQQGEEEFAIHAQKDMNTNVNNNRSTTIVGGNDTLAVQAGTQSVSVQGDTSLTVQAGNRTVSVSGGDYSSTASAAVKIHGKGAGVTVTGDSQGVAVTGNGQGVSVAGNGGPGVKISGNPNFLASGTSTAKIESPVVDIGNADIKIHGSKIELSAGGSTIVLDGSGVTINGSKVESTGGGSAVTIDGSGVTATSGGVISLQGSLIKNNA